MELLSRAAENFGCAVVSSHRPRHFAIKHGQTVAKSGKESHAHRVHPAFDVAWPIRGRTGALVCSIRIAGHFRARARLSGPRRQDHRPLRRRRHGRRRSATGRRLAVAQMGPAGHHREPHRRRRKYRRRLRLSFDARRLHAAFLAAAAAGDQPESLSEPGLRSRQIRTDHRDGPCAERADRQSEKPQGIERFRTDRIFAAEPGQGDGGHPRQRHDLASYGRTVPGDGQGEAALHSLSRVGARAAGPARRRRRPDVRQSRGFAAAGRGRQSQAACAWPRRSVCRRCPRYRRLPKRFPASRQSPGMRSWRRRERRKASPKRSMPTSTKRCASRRSRTVSRNCRRKPSAVPRQRPQSTCDRRSSGGAA